MASPARRVAACPPPDTPVLDRLSTNLPLPCRAVCGTESGAPLLVASLSVLLGQQDGRHRSVGLGDDPDASAVPQFVGREHARALARRRDNPTPAGGCRLGAKPRR